MASDWAGLPRHLLITIFQMVLDVHYDLIPLAQHWYALASVCRHWHETVSATPLMVELQTPEDLGAPVLRWLSQRCMESLSMRPAVDRKRRDELLLQYPEFIRRSGQDLQVLWNADLSTSLPLLPHFQNLNKVRGGGVADGELDAGSGILSRCTGGHLMLDASSSVNWACWLSQRGTACGLLTLFASSSLHTPRPRHLRIWSPV